MVAKNSFSHIFSFVADDKVFNGAALVVPPEQVESDGMIGGVDGGGSGLHGSHGVLGLASQRPDAVQPHRLGGGAHGVGARRVDLVGLAAGQAPQVEERQVSGGVHPPAPASVHRLVEHCAVKQGLRAPASVVDPHAGFLASLHLDPQRVGVGGHHVDVGRPPGVTCNIGEIFFPSKGAYPTLKKKKKLKPRVFKNHLVLKSTVQGLIRYTKKYT